ncbi:MAG: hypothetical protein HLUCCO18_13330 [Rhodobacteraceae bacterium HLUCCO18]|nr:MAG: hypothetical protein HLUCCO18_13330 [Rhodobacteraceae bacterium HLUCCO18]
MQFRERSDTGVVTLETVRAPDRPAAGPAHPRTIALKPLDAPANRFPGLLAEAIGDALDHRIVPFAWDRLGTGAYDTVVFHWPTEFFRPDSRRKTLALLARAARDKLRHGTRFFWIVHNLEPHDGGSLSSPLTRSLFFRLLDGLIFLSEDSRAQLHARHPETRRIASLVTAHGTYPQVARPPRPFAPPEGPVRLLFFGAIRAYKNPVGLVRAASAADGVPFELTLAGSVWQHGDLAKDIVTTAGGDPRITLDIREHPILEDELEAMIDAHDAVVLPYDKVLNSGVALHALCRNKPILGPNTGSLPELRGQVGAPWVRLFDGPFAAPHIAKFVSHVRGLSAATPDLSRHDWTRIGRETADFLVAP